MTKGKLIVIEGAIDGIGKSTQFDMLYQRLVKEGYNVVTHHFPTYNSVQGALVEEYLRGEYGGADEVSPYFVNSLFAIDRAVTWRKILSEPYNDGSIVLLDRYTTSSQLYQSVSKKTIEEKKDFIRYIEDYEYNKLEIKKPDSVIFLTAPYEVATSLRKKRTDNDGIENDIHERDEEYLKNVYDNSTFIADFLSWDKIECGNDGAMRSKEDIHEEIYRLVKKIK